MRWAEYRPDYVEKMMGHAGKSIGEIYYDGLKRSFYERVDWAWLQYRAEKH